MESCRLLKPYEAAEILNLKENTVKMWLRRGNLPGIKIGRDWRISAEGLTAYIEECVNKNGK